MNRLLQLLGLESSADVDRVLQGSWRAGQELPVVVLWAVGIAGVLLACINFLPQIAMRTSVRVGTFVLRLALVALLIGVLCRLEWHVELALRNPQQWTVLVDDSASMGTKDVDGKSRFAAALDDLKTIQSETDGRVQLTVRTFSGAPLGDEPGQGPTLFHQAVSEAALSRSRLDRLIVLTDGRDSETRDLQALGDDLRGRDVALSVRLYGSKSPPVDSGISAEPERSVIRLGEELIVRGALSGRDSTQEMTVLLKENGKDIQTLTVAATAAGRFEARHKPTVKGVKTYTVELATADAVAQNNAVSFTVNVVEEKIKVLLLEGFPRNEFKILKAVLEVDPLVDLVSVCQIPGGGVYVQGTPLHRNPEQGLITSQSDLFKYDVVVLRDLSRSYFRAGGDATESRLKNIVEFVNKRGGGLIVTGGQDVYRAGGYQDSHLAPILPFDLTDKLAGQDQFDGLFFASIHPSAYSHPLLRLLPDAEENRERLGNLRDLDGSNNVGRFKPLATPLMTRLVKLPVKGTDQTLEQEVPVLGYLSVGDGKVLAASVDTLWRWQLQPDFDDPPLTMLLANAVRFLAPPPGKKPDTPTVSIGDGTPQVGQDLELVTELKDNNFEPIRNANLVVTVTRPGGETSRIYPRDLPEEPGVYAYRVALDAPGRYKVHAKSGKFESERDFLAGAAAGEFADLSVDREAMDRLTQAARGEISTGSGDTWLKALDLAPSTKPTVRDLEVWNSPLVLALFIVVLSWDCYLRKRQGLV